MVSIHDNAILILRLLEDAAASDVKTKVKDLRRLTGLGDEEFDHADHYLLNGNYVDATMGGDEGWRRLNAKGINMLADQMQSRIQLTLDAERLVRFIFQEAPLEGENVGRKKLQRALDLDDERYEASAQEAVDLGLVDPIIHARGARFDTLGLTRQGRVAVREGFRLRVPPQVQIQTGAIIQGPVIQSNIQTVAEAYRSDVQQIVSEADPTALRDAIVRLVDVLVNSVRSELSNAQLEVYTSAVKELQEEVESDKPSPSSLQRLMSILGFAGDLDGTLELGAKAIKLAIKAGPYLLAIQQAVDRLLEMVG